MVGAASRRTLGKGVVSGLAAGGGLPAECRLDRPPKCRGMDRGVPIELGLDLNEVLQRPPPLDQAPIQHLPHIEKILAVPRSILASACAYRSK